LLLKMTIEAAVEMMAVKPAERAERMRSQRTHDKHKLYSWHAPACGGCVRFGFNVCWLSRAIDLPRPKGGLFCAGSQWSPGRAVSRSDRSYRSDRGLDRCQ